ncbi:hypothetical protein PR202_ga03639 [Eleusine coracana subsp. coracana]|uniref:NB-ARC domain-containing protein n=1 Tax=Eleusine coracana subsp. coracana TaxID=191504 RepID=A0AAV5BMH3_ELECO|nr:hypothetical protein PR202_ga03639 [Eleusine coracana subsp. coracana]
MAGSCARGGEQLKPDDIPGHVAGDDNKCVCGKLMPHGWTRYLVVIDDIWNKDDWIIINGALSDEKCGSRIIITTRKNDVAEECCRCTVGIVYNMKPLRNDSSERLFIEKAFGNKGCPPNLTYLHDSALPANISEDKDHPITADITHLFHLKYLDISGLPANLFSTDFSRLVKGIGNLQYLETIDLRGTPLSKLPSDIYNLKHLVCLFLPRGVILPDGIGQMKALEELKVITVDRYSSLEFLQELSQLTKLRLISIYMEREPTTLQQESILISSLCKLGMGNLHSLTIDIFDIWNDGSAMHCLHDSHGHSWQAAVQSLRKFSMKSGSFNKVPDWMGSMNHLEKLVLGVEEIEQKDLDILGNLQSLLYLFLMLVEYPKGGLTFRESKGFQGLRYLGTHCYPRGVMLAFESGSMLRLEHLQFDIYTCDSIICSSYNFGIEHLKSLTMIDVTIRYIKQCEDDMKKAETAIRNVVNKLPKNATLRIEKQSLL